MNSKFDTKLKAEATRYIQKNVTEAKLTNPVKANMILKRLAEAPGDKKMQQTFTLLQYVENGLSEDQQRSEILKYFSKVSQEFIPLQILQLQENIRHEMNKHTERKHLPFINSITMWQALKSLKKTSSEVPDELPASLRAEFLPCLAEPACHILNSIIATQIWAE